MIGSDVIRGYCDTILLSLLAQGDSYGYELSRTIRERSGGDYVMKETTLYSAFARLEKRGFIASCHPPTRARKAGEGPVPTTPSPLPAGNT